MYLHHDIDPKCFTSFEDALKRINRIRSYDRKKKEQFTHAQIFNMMDIEETIIKMATEICEEYKPKMLKILQAGDESITEDTEFNLVGDPYDNWGISRCLQIDRNVLGDTSECNITYPGYPSINNAIFVCKSFIQHVYYSGRGRLGDRQWWHEQVWYPDHGGYSIVYSHALGCVNNNMMYNVFNSIYLVCPTKIRYHVHNIIPFNTSLIIWSILNNRPKLTYVDSTRSNLPQYIHLGDEYSEVIVDLAHNNLKRTKSESTGNGTPRRFHPVRGHYRDIASGERIWISPHNRGDKSLGIITRGYKLTNL